MKRPAENSGPSGSEPCKTPKLKAKAKAGGPKSKAKAAKATLKEEPQADAALDEQHESVGGAGADEESQAGENENPAAESTMKRPAACKAKSAPKPLAKSSATKAKAKGNQAALKRPAAAVPAETPDGDKEEMRGSFFFGSIFVVYFLDSSQSQLPSLKLVAAAAFVLFKLQPSYGVDFCAQRRAC